MDFRGKYSEEDRLVITTSLKNIRNFTNEVLKYVDCSKVNLEFIIIKNEED